MKTKTTEEKVKEYYPEAKCVLRPTGKEYYQVIADFGHMIGQGKKRGHAWKAALNNINRD